MLIKLHHVQHIKELKVNAPILKELIIQKYVGELLLQLQVHVQLRNVQINNQILILNVIVLCLQLVHQLHPYVLPMVQNAQRIINLVHSSKEMIKHVLNLQLLMESVKQVLNQHNHFLVHLEYVQKHLLHIFLILNVKHIKEDAKQMEEVVLHQ